MSEPMRFTELQERRLLSAVDYNSYFENDNFEGVRTALLEVGKLNLPTGRIIACDPLSALGDPGVTCLPFAHAVEPGQYPVTICVVRGNTAAGGDRYAAARIKFGENRPVKWLLALRGNENLNDLTRDGDYFGYAVADGLGCFTDAGGRDAFLRVTEVLDEHGKNLYDDYFHHQFLESYEKYPLNQRENGDWFNSPIPGSEELNLIVFQSGFGDGIYPCYWGLDEEGQVSQLVTDFFVLQG